MADDWSSCILVLVFAARPMSMFSCWPEAEKVRQFKSRRTSFQSVHRGSQVLRNSVEVHSVKASLR